MTRSHFIEILMILTKYVFDLGVRLTEISVTVESVTLRFYCIIIFTYMYYIYREGGGVTRSFYSLCTNRDFNVHCPLKCTKMLVK